MKGKGKERLREGERKRRGKARGEGGGGGEEWKRKQKEEEKVQMGEGKGGKVTVNSMKGKAICRVTVLFCAMKWLSMFDMSRYKGLRLFSTLVHTINLFLTAKLVHSYKLNLYTRTYNILVLNSKTNKRTKKHYKKKRRRGER